MLEIQLFCVGKMKERHYIQAAEEYLKRLSAYCKTTVTEIPEVVLGKNPSPAEISAALHQEYAKMNIPPRSVVVALCIEGTKLSSEAFADKLREMTNRGVSKLVFVIGGSNGLAARLKQHADFCLSMSDMTFPHHMARVMLLEQLYRAFHILSGGKYHK